MTIRMVGVNLTPLSHLGPFDAQWLKAVAQQVERLGFDTLNKREMPVSASITSLRSLGATRLRFR
jgi:hypothetical protein